MVKYYTLSRRDSIVPATEPKRIKKLRSELLKAIPRFPNDKASLQALQSKSLTSLLIDYANWAIRYVSPRPRRVQVESTASGDARWQSLSTEITFFLDKVARGDDLTPHLSIEPHTRGYTPAASAPGTAADRWADKDMLLNVMGYYHFHLGMTLEPAGHAKRTNEVLFAAVTRDLFEVVAILDHSVFEMRDDPTVPISPERQRLLTIFEERAMRNARPGSVVIPAMIATSGHSMHLVRSAQNYVKVLQENEPKLDDLSFVNGLYEKAGLPHPMKPKLRWHMQLLDLGVLDETTGAFFPFRRGPN
jgi:hypothetical protein